MRLSSRSLEGKRLRFAHPPRTGGSSITTSWSINRRSGEYKGHHFPESPKPDHEWLYGTTRNPWDRAVSLYHLADPQHEPKPRSFQEWLLGGMDGSKFFGARWQDQIAQPTLKWVAEVDFLVRFETRKEDLHELAKLLGRAYPSAHAAKTPRRLQDYREYYNDEAQLYVAERYAEDISTFGYKF